MVTKRAMQKGSFRYFCSWGQYELPGPLAAWLKLNPCNSVQMEPQHTKNLAQPKKAPTTHGPCLHKELCRAVIKTAKQYLFNIKSFPRAAGWPSSIIIIRPKSICTEGNTARISQMAWNR
ncbi:tumor necrosis factor ligand superfamily member10 [Striga asiatica]|uniref:Tumor necrosis factor ligand superfamily member10 n=1 Tax=Striga asiatica TaxID=4170 RepID=A0A5A7PFM4_STRAF|nr:tumor necrosis factor ligand superfamily member10 [Striga asiatica]